MLMHEAYTHDGLHMSPTAQVLVGQTVMDVLEAAENPQWQQARHPETGELMYHADGTPMLFQVPVAQQVAPTIRKRMFFYQRLRMIPLAIMILFIGFVAVQMYAPAPIADFLQDYALTWFARIVVFGGGILVSLFVLKCAWTVLKAVFSPR